MRAAVIDGQVEVVGCLSVTNVVVDGSDFDGGDMAVEDAFCDLDGVISGAVDDVVRGQLLDRRTASTRSTRTVTVSLGSAKPPPLQSMLDRSRSLRSWSCLRAKARVPEPISTGATCTSTALVGVTGRFYDRTSAASANAAAYDPNVQRRLWQLSRDLTDAPDPS